MRRIYQNAHNVIIWLGASTEDIDRLFHWMRRLDQQMLISDYHDIMIMLENQWKFVTWRPEGDTYSDSVIRGLRDLLGREWFCRIWVIQEAALAKTATINCGHNSVNSRAFVIMPSLLDISCSESVESRLQVMPGFLRKRSWWAGSDSQDLHTLLRKFGRSKAKDPRDIIYGLLGLSKDAFTSDILRPNYQISIQEAIQHTVLYLLTQSGHIKHDSGRTVDDMPAWNMDELLVALKDLPSRFDKWARTDRKASRPKKQYKKPRDDKPSCSRSKIKGKQVEAKDQQSQDAATDGATTLIPDEQDSDELILLSGNAFEHNPWLPWLNVGEAYMGHECLEKLAAWGDGPWDHLNEVYRTTWGPRSRKEVISKRILIFDKMFRMDHTGASGPTMMGAECMAGC